MIIQCPFLFHIPSSISQLRTEMQLSRERAESVQPQCVADGCFPRVSTFPRVHYLWLGRTDLIRQSILVKGAAIRICSLDLCRSGCSKKLNSYHNTKSRHAINNRTCIRGSPSFSDYLDWLPDLKKKF